MSSQTSDILADWLMHTSIIVLTIFLVDRQAGLISLTSGVMLNIIYIGQHLTLRQIKQYSLMVEAISQFAQAICNPALAFFMAALNSYFSFSRLKISLAALLLSHYRNDIAIALFEHTGFKTSWLISDILHQSKTILEIQLTFATIASILRAILAYQHWLEIQPVPSVDEERFRSDLAQLPRSSRVT